MNKINDGDRAVYPLFASWLRTNDTNTAGNLPDFNIFLLISQEGSNEPFLPQKRALCLMSPEPVSKT
jgi:hypothetical protein